MKIELVPFCIGSTPDWGEGTLAECKRHRLRQALAEAPQYKKPTSIPTCCAMASSTRGCLAAKRHG